MTDVVHSYLDMDYSWTRDGNRIRLRCSGMLEGQAFYYHTTDVIEEAQGLSYEDLGNGYYLLRVYDNDAQITLKKRD